MSPQGRSVEAWTQASGSFQGILASASPEERLLYSQPNHDITYTIVHQGGPVLRIGDYAKFGNQNYHVQNVNNPGRIGRWTIYYCDMRRADPADVTDPNV
jgi:hypothetical protein